MRGKRPARGVLERTPRLLDPATPLLDRGSRAAALLDHDHVRRPAARPHGTQEPAPVEALAAERHEQRGTDIGVRAERLEHPEGILVGEASAEADEMDVRLAERQLDLAGHVVGTLHQVHDHDRVADSLAAVGPHEGVVTDHAEHPMSRDRHASRGGARACR